MNPFISLETGKATETFSTAAPVLLVSPDEDYVAIFSCNGVAVLLESEQGRRIRTGPLRAGRGEDPIAQTRQSFLQKGYQQLGLTQPDAPSLLERFMQRAGFTPGHVRQVLGLCSA